MNFGKIAWISVLTAWVLATLYGALLVTSAGNAESQDFGQLLTSCRRCNKSLRFQVLLTFGEKNLCSAASAF